MAYIQVINEENAHGKLKSLYKRISGRTNASVANILKVHSLNPDVLEKHLDLYECIMFAKSGLSRELREMIAVVVSASNACDY